MLLEIALTKSDVECEHAVSAEEVEAFARSLNARYSREGGRERAVRSEREGASESVCAFVWVGEWVWVWHGCGWLVRSVCDGSGGSVMVLVRAHTA